MFGRILIALALLIGLCVLVNTVPGQPPQPGDVAAPVVDVFETGLLTASITCEPTVRAGEFITFDITGTSDVHVELLIRPGEPHGAVAFDTGWRFDPDAPRLAYTWVVKAGNYAAILIVTDGRDVVIKTVYFEVTAGDTPPPGDDPPDPPPDDKFVAFIGKALEKVEAANHAEVAATFRALANRIDRRELRLSEQIQRATEAALFGPQKTLNREWVGFYNAVFGEMLDGMNLGLPEHWSRAFKTIAKEVSP